jgi:hypothetical protein
MIDLSRVLGMLLFLLPQSAWAGEVRGTIIEGGTPVPKGVGVKVQCGGGITYSDETDRFGSYRIFVSELGTCKLKVSFKGDSPTLEIESLEGSVRYDLVVERHGTGYLLRRR